MKRKSIEWTGAHRRHAEARVMELDAINRRSGFVGVYMAHLFTEDHPIDSEERFRAVLDCAPRAHRLGHDRIDREVMLVHRLATAKPEVLEMIEQACVDHARVVAKLATGQYVRESGERFYVYLRKMAEASKNWQPDRESAQFIAALPGLCELGPRIVKVAKRSIRRAR